MVNTAEFESHLMTAPVLYYYSPLIAGGGGHPVKTGAVFHGGVNAYLKFEEGANDGAQVVRNEVAAYETIKILDWDEMMGTTVLRALPSPTTGATSYASVQIFWPNAQPDLHQSSFCQTDIWQAGTFDYLVQQSDRSGHNWLGVSGTSTAGIVTQLKLIDHGFAFGLAGRPLQSTFTDMVRGQPIPDAILASVRKLESELRTSPVMDLLEPAMVDAVMSRAQHIMQHHQIP